VLVIVCPCSSKTAGEAFLEAGAQHVVAIELDADVMDIASITFTRSFYSGLFITVFLKTYFCQHCFVA
jgi:predicted methyltransferase